MIVKLKKLKEQKKCIIERELMFENYKHCLFNGEVILKSQQNFKSDHHKVYTEEVNKIALSSDDDKRLQTFNRFTTYPYGTPAVKVCENEMMVVGDFFCRKICRLSVLWRNTIKTIKISVFNI